MSSAAPSRPARPLGGLLRHSLTYSLVPILGRVLSFAMVRFYTKRLSPSENGLIGINDALIIALQQLLGQNLLAGLTRFYFEQRDERERKRLVSSCTLLLGAFAWAMCAACYPFRASLAPILLARDSLAVGADSISVVLGLTLLLVPFQLTTLSGFCYLQIHQRSSAYSVLQLVKITIELGLKVFFIAGLDLGLRGYFLAVLCGEAATTLLLCGWMLREVGLSFDRRLLAPVLRYTLPLIPAGLCQLGIHQLDRRLLELFLPNESALAAVGIYDLGYKLGQIANLVMLGPLLQIWQPWVFAIEDARQRAHEVARVATYAVLAIGALSLGLMLLGRQGVWLLDGSEERAFQPAWRVIPWVSCGYVLWAVYQASQLALYLDKRTLALLGINAFALLVNIGANAFLIPHYAELGAAIATTLTFGVLAGSAVLLVRARAGVELELRRLGSVLACVAFGAAFALWIDAPPESGGPGCSMATAFAAKLAALALLYGVLAGLVLRSDERRALFGWLRARASLA